MIWVAYGCIALLLFTSFVEWTMVLTGHKERWWRAVLYTAGLASWLYLVMGGAR